MILEAFSNLGDSLTLWKCTARRWAATRFTKRGSHWPDTAGWRAQHRGQLRTAEGRGKRRCRATIADTAAFSLPSLPSTTFSGFERFAFLSLLSFLTFPYLRFLKFILYIYIYIYYFFYGQWKRHSFDMVVQWFPDPELQCKYNIVFSFTLFMGQHFQWPFQFSLSCYLRITSFASSKLVFMLWWAGHSGGKFFSVWKTRNTVGIQAISFSMPFPAS